MKHLLALLFLAPLFLAAQGTRLFTPSAADLELRCPPMRPCTAALAERDNRTVLRLTQTAEQGNFIEFQFPARRPLLEAKRYRFSIDIYLPENHGGKYINPRFTDANGETFQLRHPLTPKDTGWKTLVYDLDSSAPLAESWGSNANQKIEFPLNFVGFAFSAASSKTNRAFDLAQISVETYGTRLLLGLETGNPVHVLKPADDHLLALTFTNQGAETQIFTGDLAITDAWGNTLTKLPLNQTVPPLATSRLPLTAPQAFGVFSLHLNGQDAMGPVAARLAFSRMIPAGPTPNRSHDFIFGAHYHAFRYNAEDNEKDMLAAALCGVKCFRIGSTWPTVQHEKDKPINFARYEAVLDRCEKYGIEVQPIIGSTPAWAVDKDWQPAQKDFQNRFGRKGIPAPDLDAWKTYVTDFMTHFRGRIRFTESWNEPDLLSFANFSADTYIAIQKIFHDTIKEVAPETITLTGGYAGYHVDPTRSSHPEHLTYTLDKTRGWYDAVAFHGHGPHSHFYPQIRNLRAYLRKIGATPLWWANETACSTRGYPGELIQAACLFRKLLYTRANGGIGYNWYDLRNDGYDITESEHNYGMLTRDFYPKAVYGVYNTLASWFHCASYHREFIIADDFQAYLFQNPQGDYLIPCWNIADRKPSRLLALHNLSGTVSVIDLFGNETPIKSDRGLAFLESTSYPIIIRIRGQIPQPQLAPSPIAIPDQAIIHPLKSTDIPVTVTNPFNAPFQGTLTLTANDNYTLDHTQIPFDLPPHERLETSFRLTCAPRNNLRNLTSTPLKITFATAGGLQHDSTLQLKQLRLLPAQFADQPDFTIDDESHLHSFIINEPATSHLLWKGPADSSARVWLACANDKLLLKVEVTDDAHCQAFPDADIWQGDSVQFSIVTDEPARQWKFGLARRDDQNVVALWDAPKDIDAATVCQRLTLQTERDDAQHLTRYLATLPLDAIGLTHESALRGFTFNLIVNDNDGPRREAFLFLAPGLGSNFSTRDYIPLAVEK